MNKGTFRHLGFTYERNKNDLRPKCSIRGLRGTIELRRVKCNIIAFYANAKQVLILFLIWLKHTFISAAHMRPSVGFSLIKACQSGGGGEHHIAARLISHGRPRRQIQRLLLRVPKVHCASCRRAWRER